MKNTFCILFFCFAFIQAHAQIFSEGYYNYKVSPLIGVSQWTKTTIDIGICTEFHHGKDVWQPKPTRFCHLFAQSLSAEILLQSEPLIIPKYSFWLHSSKLFMFSIGSSVLYTQDNGVFIRPECGIILPKEKMEPLFGIGYLRIKLSYGYNISFSDNPLPYESHNVSLVVYFGNNIGSYRAMK